MNVAAVKHVPLSHMAYGLADNTVVIRIQTARDDVESVLFCFGDTAFQGHPVPYEERLMSKVGSCDRYDYYEVRLSSPTPRMVYYFLLIKENQSFVYTADFFVKTVPKERNDLYKFPYYLPDETIQIPSWFKEAVVYNIFPDSFHPEALKSSSPTKQRLGGTLRSITEAIPYFKDFGIRCLYLNPIFKAGEYHKYDTIDYYSVDPCFGTNDDFRTLVDLAHKEDIKIVIDGVFNHAGCGFKPFNAWLDAPQGTYKDWFFQVKEPLVRATTSSPDVSYACFGYEKHMPKLNLSNPQAQQYFLDVAAYWTKTFNIDGWRLDVADETAPSFWRKFRERIKSIRHDAVLLGEVWQTASSYLDGTMFDGLMNYDLLKHLKTFFVASQPDAKTFGEKLTYQVMRYREEHVKAQLNFLDTHDVSRFYSLIQESDQKYRLAWVFLFTFVGVPMIFYGDEAPLTGLDEKHYRQAFTSQHALQFKPLIASLIELRKKHPTLVDGRFEIDDETHGSVLIYRRMLANKVFLVYLNLSPNPYHDIRLKNAKPLLSEGLHDHQIEPYGFVVCELEETL